MFLLQTLAEMSIMQIKTLLYIVLQDFCELKCPALNIHHAY